MDYIYCQFQYFKMRDRELNLNIKDQKELTRIKSILFPKKQNNFETRRQPLVTKLNCDNGVAMRSQIDKLRGQITSLLSKGKCNDIVSNHTEKAYLDGINKLSKDFKYNASDINQVFDQFIAHLPTKFINEIQHYTTHYYYSMLVQNVVWDKIEGLMKKPLIDAFLCLKEQSQEKRQMQSKIDSIQSQRKNRINARNYFNLEKYFSKWRLNNKCIKAKIQAQDYLKQNNIENDQRLIHNLLNFPLLILMLQELGLQACDTSQILILDESKGKACKFIEQGQSIINTSLQTVTQRSLLQTQRSNIKFSRFDINITASLTKQCIDKGEILFIDSLSKHLDYSQIDNLCYWQSLNKSNPQCLKGGAVFYPIFDINQECIGVLRQYFYQGSIKAISSKRLEKICVFLQLGMKMDKRMRLITKQKQYQREGYYIKMIELVKSLEVAQGSEKDLINKLSDQLLQKFKISKLTIYRVQSKQNDNLRGILLRKIWGDGQDSSFILTLLHQLLKQHSNYIYLDNRLIVYSNPILFDLKIQENIYTDVKDVITDNNQKNILPIQLIVSTLAKVQTILSTKQKQNAQIQIQQQIKQEKIKQQQTNNLKNIFQAQSLKFISQLSKNQSFTTQIDRYIEKIHAFINELSFSQKKQYKQAKFYLQCKLSNSKKDRFIIKLEQIHREANQQQKCSLGQLIMVQINQYMNIYCSISLQKEGKQLIQSIKSTIKTFINKYILQFQQSQNKYINYTQFQKSFINKQLLVSPTPSRQQKRQWEKHSLILIYQIFQEAVDKFIYYSFSNRCSSVWMKQEPNDKNIQEWKQAIYKVMLTNPSNTKFEIINKNPIIGCKDYNQIKALTNYSFSCIPQQSTLIISNNKPIYRSKNTINDHILALTLPIYFYLHDQNSEDSIVQQNLKQLKLFFIRLCEYFLKGVNNFNNLLQINASNLIFNCYSQYQAGKKKQAFCKLQYHSRMAQQKQKRLRDFISCLSRFQVKLLQKSFIRIFTVSVQMEVHNKNQLYCYNNVVQLSNKIGHSLFKNAFISIKKYSKAYKKLTNLIKKIQIYNQNYQRQILRTYFFTLEKLIRRQSKIVIFNEIMHKLTIKPLFNSFNKLKNIKGQKCLDNVFFNEIQKCKSLQEMKSKINQIVPNYCLFLQINQEQCHTIYSNIPQHYNQFRTIQSTYNPSSGALSYQCGSEGQLIWNYNLNKDQNCFQIKDKLNSLAKCIELGIRNCQKVMEINLIKCSMFHRSWIKRIKLNLFKKWALQSHHAQMLQRNRLNDSLYQISIQTQTIKQKLKCQEKIIKNHNAQYQELLKKQQEYKNSIKENNQKIQVIEENQSKLESAKFVYHSLHRRSTIKTIFLIWKKNATVITLSLAKRFIKNNISTKKIGFNVLAKILSSKKSEYLRQFKWRIRQTKKDIIFKSKDIQKIQVMFEQRGNRLITFQSQFQELQNSYQHSNRQLEQTQLNYSKRIFDRQRSPLQRVQLSEEEYSRYSNGAYKLNPKTLKFLKRMGKLQN